MTSKDTLDAWKVKQFLLRNPEFLDNYVKSSVELANVESWLKNKERMMQSSKCGQTNLCSPSKQPRKASKSSPCPNTSLIGHFERGQRARRYLEPTCCTCTQLPIGPKARRPYIIYACDEDTSENGVPNFTVPRVMTEQEILAFGRRYGMDLYRRMNMY